MEAELRDDGNINEQNKIPHSNYTGNTNQSNKDLSQGIIANTDIERENDDKCISSVTDNFGKACSTQESVNVDTCVTGDSKCMIEEDSDDEYESADDGEESDEFIPTPDMLATEEADSNLSNSPSKMTKDDCNDADESEDEDEPTPVGDEAIDPLEARKKLEQALTPEEKKERTLRSQELKDEGNKEFRNGSFDEGINLYTEALDLCPLDCHKERSIMFANRAACKMKQESYEDAIADSTSALELHPHYLKAMLRRAELYEKTDKLDEALKDYQRALELDPSQHAARAACMRLAEQIKERNEKMKEEMMAKLKDLGNMVLRPFGLSTNNFNLQQDPNTGSYSVQFNQNQPGNGS